MRTAVNFSTSVGLANIEIGQFSINGVSLTDTGFRTRDLSTFTPASTIESFNINGRSMVQVNSGFTNVLTSNAVAPVAATTIKYRMRGYFIAGSAYEFWVTTDPTSAPPSGNPLINKIIDSVIA